MGATLLAGIVRCKDKCKIILVSNYCKSNKTTISNYYFILLLLRYNEQNVYVYEGMCEYVTAIVTKGFLKL